MSLCNPFSEKVWGLIPFGSNLDIAAAIQAAFNAGFSFRVKEAPLRDFPPRYVLEKSTVTSSSN